jgi:hypothetical protein
MGLLIEQPYGVQLRDTAAGLTLVVDPDLMKLAEVGKRMLFDAIYVADEQNDATFFEEAFSHYGRVIYEALMEMDLPNRCTLCGVLMPHTDECSHRRTGNQ